VYFVLAFVSEPQEKYEEQRTLLEDAVAFVSNSFSGASAASAACASASTSASASASAALAASAASATSVASAGAAAEPVDDDRLQARRPARLVDPARLDVNSIRVLGQVGAGGFGKVFKGIWTRVRDESLSEDIPVAIKQTKNMEGSVELESLESAAKELRTAASIPLHPNVLELFGYYVSAEGLCIVTPLYPTSLDKQMSRHPEWLTPQNITAVVKGSLQGLLHLHDNGFAHRDFAPRNILLSDLTTSTPHPVLCDFGLSGAWKTVIGYAQRRCLYMFLGVDYLLVRIHDVHVQLA